MNDIKINGTTEILGRQIKNVAGGFGENQKCILADDVAKVHNTRVDKVNDLIRNNINRFNDNDLIDLKSKPSESLQLLGFTNMQIAKSNNVFLLSERGYTKLVSMMSNDNDKKFEVMDRLIDEYFSMKEFINSNEQLKAKLLLDIYNGGDAGIIASKKLSELESKPLLDKIEEDKPLVTFANTCLTSKDSILVRELAKIICDEGIQIGERRLYQKLREWNYIFKHSTEPTQVAMDKGYFEVIQGSRNTVYGTKLFTTTKVTPKGQLQIIDRLKREI